VADLQASEKKTLVAVNEQNSFLEEERKGHNLPIWVV
jgi:hypothetical protein